MPQQLEERRLESLDRTRIEVDFNEMVEPDVVLLATSDEVIDSSGDRVILKDGIRVYLYAKDADENGVPRLLLASGIVERNVTTDWSQGVKWRCRIDEWGEWRG
jgi:hypothetical protein